MDTLETMIFCTPVAYNLCLGVAYIGRRSGLLKPIDPLYHNYSMVIQSCLLLVASLVEYWTVASSYKLPIADFVAVSHAVGTSHQSDVPLPFLLRCFLLSKLCEWFDTILLILNGKKVILLHWWHHATIGVAFYTGYYTSSVVWIGALNSLIHVIMYLYYANFPGIRPMARYLTQLQIVQLFGGVWMNVLSYQHNHTRPKYQWFSVVNGLICLSYGAMFVRFYGKRYKKRTMVAATPVASEVQTPQPAKKIIIGEYEYDTTNFKHPGGNVIQYMTNGQDATEAFHEFHYRSDRARAVLASLPKTRRESPHPTDRALLDDFRMFRQSLVDRGFFRPSYAHVAYRLAELCGLFALAAHTIPTSPIVSTFLFGLFSGRCGWVQHEGGHNSLTGNMRCDKWIQAFFIGFGLHSSGSMWNQMHNKHHATPQKVNHDIDLDTTPLVAFFDTAVEKNRRRAYSKWWLRWQAYTFLPVTSGVFVPLFWAVYLHPRQVIRERNVMQAVWMAMGHLVRPYLFVALGGVAWYQAVLYHLLSTWWGDMYLFGHFALSHTTTPVVEHDEDPSWVRYAVEHGVDITPQNPLVSWTMGYLNCQVVHHLFPSMPQFRGPAVSLELSRWCEKWQLSYQIIGYWEAWRAMFANLDRVGRVYHGKWQGEGEASTKGD